MPASKPKRSSAAPRRAAGSGAGGRLQTFGLFLVMLVVAALLVSLVWGGWLYLHPSSRAAAPAGSPPSAADGARAAAAAPVGRVRVQVLNATGTHGLARKATDVLRDHRFDVVETGNAPRGTDPAVSVVYDRVGRLDVARQVADALGIRRVEARRDPNLYLDATVVLGRDWQSPPANGAAEAH